jgi:hypothetical protein
MKILPILFLCLLVQSLIAQKGIVGSGGNASNSNGSISYSIGQIDYVAISNSTGAINAGIQQPYEILVSYVDEAFISFGIDVFPNPTTDILNIRLEEFRENLRFQLVDMNGRIISDSKISELLQSVHMQELPKSTYLLTVLENAKSVKSFSIIKK